MISKMTAPTKAVRILERMVPPMEMPNRLKSQPPRKPPNIPTMILPNRPMRMPLMTRSARKPATPPTRIQVRIDPISM